MYHTWYRSFHRYTRLRLCLMRDRNRVDYVAREAQTEVHGHVSSTIQDGWRGTISRVKRQRLLRGEARVHAEPQAGIAGTKSPDERVPGRAVPGAVDRRARD